MSAEDAKTHYLFIMYRNVMPFDDHVSVHAVYTGAVDGKMHAQSKRQVIVYPETAPLHKLRPEDEMLNETVLSGVADFVMKYCQPGDLFVVFVHNRNHELHHPRDRELALELPAVFECDIKDIDVVEVVLGTFEETCAENAQPLLSFLA